MLHTIDVGSEINYELLDDYFYGNKSQNLDIWLRSDEAFKLAARLANYMATVFDTSSWMQATWAQNYKQVGGVNRPELLAEVFIQISKALPKYDFHKGEITTYLYNVVPLNTKRALETEIGSEWHADVSIDTLPVDSGLLLQEEPFDTATKRTLDFIADNLIQLLPEKHLEIFRMVREGYTWAEIGKAFNTSPTTVRTWHQTTIDTIREHFVSDLK